MHLDDERLQRLLSGELEPDVAASISGSSRLLRALPGPDDRGPARGGRGEPAAGFLDHPAPRLDPEDVMHASRGVLGWGRRAALVFLGLGLAGVAYAAPGSPVPGWLRSIATPTRPAPAAPVPRSSADDRSGDPGVSGIAVSPGERLADHCCRRPPRALAYVSLGDSADIAFGWSRARRRSAPASIGWRWRRRSSAVFRIVVPRAAPRVEIRAGRSRLFLKRGARITAAVEPSPQGVYLLRVAPHRP